MITLVILDGFGINKSKYGNAIKLQGTPYLDKLKHFPRTELLASGEAVGLSDGQMGNSEVGHLNLGAGRIVYQDLPKINNEIANGNFFKNPALNKTMDNCLAHNSNLHIMGLVSDGGVHSHINHLYALVDMAKNKGIENIYIHCFMDGRDTLRDSGVKLIEQLKEHTQGKAEIKSLCGRVYAMDRENRWDRIEKAYDMLTLGKADNYYQDPITALNDSYKDGIYDEFVLPTIIGKPVTIDNYDSVIFFNYRTDRAREITQALTQKPFDKFETKHLNNLTYCCMTEYNAEFKDVLIAYPPEKIGDNLSAIVSNAGLKQFHTSETTKYAHVTFFFNGGIEKPYKNEDRKLIESENVQDFSQTPKMKAYEITDEVIRAIVSQKYDFILVNLSNPDMLGHTGNLEATKKTIEVVDKCAYAIALACLTAGGHCIITADHGNCEEMLDKKGNIITSHTTNPVPLWLISEKYKNVKLSKGKLCNVAPTILKIMGLEKDIPESMSTPLF